MRAAGRVCAPAPQGAGAHVFEADPLLRLQVADAAEALGYTVVAHGELAAVAFVGLDAHVACPRLRSAGPPYPLPAARPGAAQPLIVGYGAGPASLLGAHERHHCTDMVVALRAVAGAPRFVHLPADDPARSAGLSPREADVLTLLLVGLTTEGIARRLGVSPATARSHCRAVLRKLGAPHRRALRARLLGAPSPAAAEVCPDLRANFAQESPLAGARARRHT